MAFKERPSLLCELKHSACIVDDDELVRNETLHELRECLMPGLIKDEASSKLAGMKTHSSRWSTFADRQSTRLATSREP